jgi:hypothetical protein
VKREENHQLQSATRVDSIPRQRPVVGSTAEAVMLTLFRLLERFIAHVIASSIEKKIECVPRFLLARSMAMLLSLA